MTLQEIWNAILGSGGFWTAVVILFLTIIEVTPIKINPWSWFGKIIGKAFTGEVVQEIGRLKEEIGCLRTEFGGIKNEVGDIRQKVQGLKQDVYDVGEEAKEREATNCRARILEFGDEILHNVSYSKEHWDSVLMDIDKYEDYCADHPRYINNVASATIKHIKNMYDKHLADESFL